MGAEFLRLFMQRCHFLSPCFVGDASRIGTRSRISRIFTVYRRDSSHAHTESFRPLYELPTLILWKPLIIKEVHSVGKTSPSHIFLRFPSCLLGGQILP